MTYKLSRTHYEGIKYERDGKGRVVNILSDNEVMDYITRNSNLLGKVKKLSVI